METVERFVLTDLPDRAWSVTWPGYEMHVVNNATKAANLLKILFDDIGVGEAMLGVQEYNKSDKFETMHISQAAWFQDREATARYVAELFVVVGCKFVEEEQARKFKLHMEQRLAWRRLGGAWK
jgi:hypothetical protein